MRRHRADDTVSKAINRLIRADLIVVDDVGMLPVAAEAAEALFRIVDAAYERRSLALTSNLHPAGFDELIPKTLAGLAPRSRRRGEPMATSGEKPWPPVGSNGGRGWGDPDGH